VLYLVYSAFRGAQIPEAVISGVPRSADAAAVRQGALQALYGGFPGTVNVKALEMGVRRWAGLRQQQQRKAEGGR